MVRAVFFDVYGTLVDLGPLADACDPLLPGRGAELATQWRTRQLEMTWLRTIMDSWADFDQVTADALAMAVDELGAAPARERLAAVEGAFRALPARDGVAPALDALRAAGLRLGVLSNGSRPMLAATLMAADLGAAFDDVLSADAVERYKPDAAIYGLAAAVTGLPEDRIGFVTANGWDAAGACAFGFRVAWLQPDPTAVIPPVGAPNPIVATWTDVPTIFTT